MGEGQNKLIYASSEQLIKTYRYLSSSNKDQESDEEKVLTVTTNRIILESSTSSGFVREEYPIECIDYVDSSFYHSKIGKLGLLFIILGVIIIGVSFVGFIDEILPYLKLILIGIGTILLLGGILYFIFNKSKQSFKLTLFSKSEFHKLAVISGENFHKKEKIQKNNKNRKKTVKEVKVISKVSPAAIVMINELSALIIDLKTYQYQMKENYKLVSLGKLTFDEYNTLQVSALNKIIDTYREVK